MKPTHMTTLAPSAPFRGRIEVGAYLYITATFAVFFLPPDVLIDLTREDHYFENAGAVSS